jgi:hypothetical protein
MLVAAIYDIHGNFPALEAVLTNISQLGVDRLVVGGDVVPGPAPRETLARLLKPGYSGSVYPRQRGGCRTGTDGRQGSLWRSGTVSTRHTLDSGAA